MSRNLRQRLDDENNSNATHHAKSRCDIFLLMCFKDLGISITATDLHIHMLTDGYILAVIVPH